MRVRPFVVVCVVTSIVIGSGTTVAYAGFVPPSIPGPMWDEAAEIERCNTAPLADVGPYGPGRVPPFGLETWVDLATFKNVVLDARDVCRQRAALTPDPAGDMGAAFAVRDAKVEAQYCEKESHAGGSFVVCTQRISALEGSLRLAVQKRARPGGDDIEGLSLAETCEKFYRAYPLVEVGPPEKPGLRLSTNQKAKGNGKRAGLLAQLTADESLGKQLADLAALAKSKTWTSDNKWYGNATFQRVNARCGEPGM